jgi:hypothetical protein
MRSFLLIKHDFLFYADMVLYHAGGISFKIGKFLTRY